MYVTTKMLDEIVTRFGNPQHVSFEFTVSEHEFKRIKSSQKHGRKHDITMYILKDNKVVVIAKPFYPPGLYRAPSGGLQPGESFTDGALREAREETGCEIMLQRFLLQSDVRFISEIGVIAWTSFVMQAVYQSGEFQFTDHDEIREVRLAGLQEFDTFGKIMRASDIRGLHYRAALHEAVAPLLQF